MDRVFVLHHVRYEKEGDPWSEENVKLIGVYRSAEKAKEAIERLVTMPGFRNHPELIDPTIKSYTSGFTVDEFELDQDNWSEGFGFD